MPSKSKSQQRFFGMVDAYKKGELKNASSKIKKAAKGMSTDDVKDFAETKHKGLPEKVEEQTIVRLTESDLHKIVKESVKMIIEGEFDKDGGYYSGKEINAIEDAFTPKKGADILNGGAKVVQGYVNPERYYYLGRYTHKYSNSLADAIIEYPDGRKHTLIRK